MRISHFTPQLNLTKTANIIRKAVTSNHPPDKFSFGASSAPTKTSTTSPPPTKGVKTSSSLPETTPNTQSANETVNRSQSSRSEPSQIINASRIDLKKLLQLLKVVYGTDEEGKGNFKVELRLNKYKIYPSVESPKLLTEDQVNDCRVS